MKQTLLVLAVCLAFIGVSAQNKTFNLNKGDDVFNKISNFEATNNVSFDNATRIRELEINPVFQSNDFIGVDDTILLYLFSNKQYKANIDKIEVDVNGTLVIRARLIDYNYGYCIISTFNGKSLIKIEVPDNNELFLSRYDHQTNTYYLLQIDKSKQKALPGSPSLIPPVDNQPMDNPKKKTRQNSLNIKPYDIGIINGNPVLHNSDPLKSTKVQDVISLLLLYTPSAASWASANEGTINNTISLLMSNAQLALDNSNTQLTVQLVHSEQISYTELNNEDDLYNLTDPGDGIIDNVHTLRNTYCADVVVLLENIDFTGGLGFLLTDPTGDPDYAFSLTRVQQASWTYTTIHEIGHNMGCHHHISQSVQPGPGINSYSAGWRWGNSTTKYCSVMTYEDGSYFPDGIDAERVALFSNPSLQDHGYPAGDSVDGDNARTIRELKSIIADYRSGCACIPPSTQASSFTSSAITDSSMTVGWTRGNGNGVLVVARAGSAVNATPVSGTTYPANAAFGNGAQIGTGNYVVYEGTNTSVNVTALSAGTDYHYAVFEYDTTGTCFKTPGLTGDAITTGSPAPGCDTLTNFLQTDFSTYYYFVSPYWGYTPGHNSYNISEYAEHYSGLTNPYITSVEVSVAKAYSGGSGGNHKVTFKVYEGGDTIPGIVLGSKDVEISTLTADALNTIYFDSLIAFTGTDVYIGYQIYYDAPADTFCLYTAASRPDQTNSAFLNYNNEWYSFSDALDIYSSINISPVICAECTVFPAAAGTISGATTVCQGQSSVTYTVPAIPNATSYDWTIPSGATGTSTTNSITVDYGSSAVSGDIIVKGSNSCGNGASSTLAIAVNPMPGAAGTISGNATVCQGQSSVTYTIPAIANATSYVWTLPSGATGTSTTNSISVNYGTSAVSGNIAVKGTNSFCDGAVSTLPITVKAKPATPTITLNGLVLQSDAPTGNQWYDQNGAIAGAINQDYSVNTNGDYYVIVTLQNCSSDPSGTITITNAGIESVFYDGVVKIYPNPVSNELVIESTNNSGNTSFEILNSIGQKVYGGNVTDKTIVPTTDFAPGVYVIKLDDGRIIEFKKIVKE